MERKTRQPFAALTNTRSAHPTPVDPSPQTRADGGRVGDLRAQHARSPPENARAPVGWLAVVASDRPTRAAARMSVATLASRGVGFVKVWVIAAVLGATYLGNTYQASSSVSNILFELIAAGALSAVLVPTFVDLFRAEDDAEAERLASGVLGLALALMAVVSIVGIVLATPIARLLSSGAPNAHVESQQTALSAFFLRFFIPQVLLYAIGTVATAVLFAKRRFVIVAVAPIANAVILVATMAAFHIMHGSTPSLDLTTPEKLVLAIGGTLGVVGFVGVPTVALLRSGFRLRATLGAVDRKLRRLLWLSAWVALQPDVAVLLGAALVMGNQVAGGVVAYQFCFVAFLAPYAILAQPIHTTILPELTVDAGSGDMRSFADRLRWGLDSMSRLLLPVSAAYVALALPAMRVLAVGNSRHDADLFAAALASLGVGLFTYGTFLFFARASYALGDSRTPAIIAGASALVGAGVMVVGGLTFESDTAKVAALGLGHSAAYLLGTLVLGFVLRRRVGHGFFPHAFLPALAASAALGGLAWLVEHLVGPSGRVADVLVLLAIGLVGLGLYLLLLRMLPRRGARLEAAFEPIDPDLAVEP
jgi:putative peptidoglycan lipid II flippase